MTEFDAEQSIRQCTIEFMLHILFNQMKPYTDTTCKIIICLLLSVLQSGCAPTEPEIVGEGTVIPAGMKVSEVISSDSATWGKQTDLEAPLRDQLWDRPTVLENGVIENVQLPTFEPKSTLLLRHLASSAQWRVTEENGKIVAVRRYVDERGNWTINSNGYGRKSLSKESRHLTQWRTRIYLERPWFELFPRAPFVDAKSEKITIPIKTDPTQGNESLFRDSLGSSFLEIFEQSDYLDRRFTQFELRQVKKELDALACSKTAQTLGYDRKLMPDSSIRRGSPQLKVRSASTVDYYEVDAFLNPGEAGKCYLKVFEATKNLRLSESGISENSVEYLGWSGDPNDNFFFNCLIPIFEVNDRCDFAARFEIWFVPTDKKRNERKLFEEIYRIPHRTWAN